MRDAGGTRVLMSARAGTGPAPAPAGGQRPPGETLAGIGNASAGGAWQLQRGPCAAPAPAQLWERDTGDFRRSNDGDIAVIEWQSSLSSQPHTYQSRIMKIYSYSNRHYCV